MVLDILFDGEGITEQFDIQLAERPLIPVAEAIYDTYEVPGRNALREFSHFENTVLTLRFNYIDSNAKPKFGDILNWLHGKRKYQESGNNRYRLLTMSILNVSDANNDIPEWCDFEIEIETEPFWYEDAGTETITDTAIIRNPSKIDAGVIMRVFGTGTCRVRINNNQMEFVDVQEQVEVNGILKTAYRDNENMSGQYPELLSGENDIEISGQTERIEIEKRWCWR